MAIQRGTAVIFGTGTMVWTGVITSTDEQAYHQSVSMTRDSQKVEVLNGDGDVVTQVFIAKKRTLNVTVVPYHEDGIASGITDFAKWSLGSGGQATIANASATTMDDVYNIISTNTNLTNAGVAVVDLVLESYDDQDVTLVATA